MCVCTSRVEVSHSSQKTALCDDHAPSELVKPCWRYMGAYSFTSGVSVKTTGMFWKVFFRLCHLYLQACGAPLIVTSQKSVFYLCQHS